MEQVSQIHGNPSQAEAAAAIAAVELFIADTTIVVDEGADQPTGWRAAAVFEAVGLHDPNPLW